MVSRRPLCCRILLVTAAVAVVTGAAGTVAVEGEGSPGVLDEIRAEGSGLGKVRIVNRLSEQLLQNFSFNASFISTAF